MISQTVCHRDRCSHYCRAGAASSPASSRNNNFSWSLQACHPITQRFDVLLHHYDAVIATSSPDHELVIGMVADGLTPELLCPTGMNNGQSDDSTARLAMQLADAASAAAKRAVAEAPPLSQVPCLQGSYSPPRLCS